jgi:hypothetical protein
MDIPDTKTSPALMRIKASDGVCEMKYKGRAMSKKR